MTRHEPQLPPLRKSSNQQHSFHPGERLTDTLPGTATKEKVRKLWSFGLGLRGPALQVKNIWIVEREAKR
jgi:hypothetical protein